MHARQESSHARQRPLAPLLFGTRLDARQPARDVALRFRQSLHVERHRLDHPLDAGQTRIRIVVVMRVERVSLALHAAESPRAEQTTGGRDTAEEQAQERNQFAWVHGARVWQSEPRGASPCDVLSATCIRAITGSRLVLASANDFFLGG